MGTHWEVALPRVTKAIMRSLQLVLLGLACVLGDPDVFDNYFDDSLRFVDVPQEVVLKACLPNGDDTVKKIQKAYDKCFGNDYSFDDLADTVGRDSDNDDLPDEYEGNEACFYKTMDWVKGNEVQPSVIEADMAGVPGFEIFKANINSCSAWSGNFGGRRKRAVGEDTEEVPSIMESGSGALQWVKSLVRRARSAEPGNDKNEGGKEKKNKKGGKKKGKKGGKGGVRKGKKGGKKGGKKKGGKNGKKGGKSATKTRKRKNGNSKKGKNGKKNVRKSNKKNGGKKGNKGKNGNKANKANRKKGGKKGKKGNKGGNKARKGRKNKKGGKNKKNKQDKKKDKKQQRKQERKEKKKEKKKNDKKND